MRVRTSMGFLGEIEEVGVQAGPTCIAELPDQAANEGLGLSLADGKALLAWAQQSIVQRQLRTREDRERCCAHCDAPGSSRTGTASNCEVCLAKWGPRSGDGGRVGAPAPKLGNRLKVGADNVGSTQLLILTRPSAKAKPVAATLRKRTREFLACLQNNADSMPDYGQRWHAGLRISNAFAESTVNQVIDKRMSSHSRCAGRHSQRMICFRLAFGC
jgi:hypothetical protein